MLRPVPVIPVLWFRFGPNMRWRFLVTRLMVISGRSMLRPCDVVGEIHDIHNPMNMVGHDHVFVQTNMGEMVG